MEQKYLTGIISDIDVNIEDLKDAINNDSSWLENNKYALRLLFEGTLPRDSANSLMLKMAHFSKFTAQTNTYENITNSGNLNLITSYEHKQSIVKYYKSLEDFKLLEEYFKEFNTRNFMPYMIENFDMFSTSLIVDGEEKSTMFKNIFGIFFSVRKNHPHICAGVVSVWFWIFRRNKSFINKIFCKCILIAS